MPGLPARPALVLAAPFAAVLAVVGGLALDGSGVVGLCVVTVLVGAAWAAAAWEESRSGEVALVAGAQAAARIVGGFLVVCGAALLVGTPVTLLAGALIAAAVVLLRRPDPSRAAPAGAPLPDEPESPIALSSLHPAVPTFRISAGGSARTIVPPVRILSIRCARGGVAAHDGTPGRRTGAAHPRGGRSPEGGGPRRAGTARPGRARALARAGVGAGGQPGGVPARGAPGRLRTTARDTPMSRAWSAIHG